MSDAIRALKIKTGVVNRLAKDVNYSTKESHNERERLQKLKNNGGDEYEIRAQDKVIADADQMIPDYKKRLQAALDDLESMVVSFSRHYERCKGPNGLKNSGEPALKDTEELAAAKQTLQHGRIQL